MLEYSLRAFGSPAKRKERRISKSGLSGTLTTYAHSAGALSALRAEGMLGIIKLEAVVFVPLGRDMPLLFQCRLKAMGNDTLMLDLCDIQLAPADLSAMDAVKAEYAFLSDRPRTQPGYIMSPSVRKQIRNRRQAAAAERFSEKWLDAYLVSLEKAPECSREEKRRRAQAFAERLIASGGGTVSEAKRLIGEEEFSSLVREVVLGMEE